MFEWVYPNTHTNVVSVHKAVASVLRNASVQYDPLQTLRIPIQAKGSLCAGLPYPIQTPKITLFLRRFNPPHQWVKRMKTVVRQ